MKLEATGYSDAKRIIGKDGELLAMAMRYTSGFWAVHDASSDAKLCEARHKTPLAAMRWFADQQEATQ